MHHFITQKMNQLIENVISYKNNDPLLACLKSTTSSKYSRDAVWKIEAIRWECCAVKYRGGEAGLQRYEAAVPLALAPWTYHAPVLRLPVCLLVCLPPVGSSWGCAVPVGEESWPPPAGSPSGGLLSTVPVHRSAAIWSAALPSLCFLLCAHKDTVSIRRVQTDTRTHICEGANNALNELKPQWTAGFHRRPPKQLEGRLICFFPSRDESPTCHCVKSALTIAPY